MADVIVRVVNFLTPLATGNLDIGHADFGGATPKAVIIFGCNAADDETVEADTLTNCVGFASNGGGATGAHFCQILDNQTTSNTNCSWRTARVLTGNAIAANVGSWVANGVRLNFTAVAGTQQRWTAVIIGGADVTAACNVANMGAAVNPTVDVTSPTFTPDLVLLHSSVSSSTDGINAGNARTLFGAATLNGDQRCWTYGDLTGNTTASEPRAALYNTHSIVKMNLSSTTPDWTGLINDFDANGFSIAITGTTTNERFHWLALKVAGAAIKLIDLTHRTTTGDLVVTTPAFTPQAVIFAGTGTTSFNTVQANNLPASAAFIGAADVNLNQGAHAIADDFSVDPSNTKQLHPHKAISQGSTTDLDATRATLVSMDTGAGFTLNYDQVQGIASCFWAVVFQVGEEPVPSVTAPIVSQMAMMVLTANETFIRASQMAMLVLGDRQPCLTKRAQLWKIERKDGVVLAFTGHDRPITYGLNVYTPCGSLNPSASQAVADIESVSSQEFSGIVDSEQITEADILAGKYDDAYVQVFLVSWEEVDGGVDSVRRLMAGWVGDSGVAENGWRFEVLGPGARLSQRAVNTVVTPGCRWELGDENCEVDVAGLMISGEVVSVLDDGSFRVELSPHTSAAQYDGGKVVWGSGPNDGMTTDIKTLTFQSGDEADIVLWDSAPYRPTVGDLVDVFPGCDKTAATCKAVYDNKLNFGGFDQVPGNDALVSTPDATY